MAYIYSSLFAYLENLIHTKDYQSSFSGTRDKFGPVYGDVTLKNQGHTREFQFGIIFIWHPRS